MGNPNAQLSGLEEGPAYDLFTQPQRRAPVRPEEQEVHDRAVRSTLPVDGKRVAVYTWGDGSRPVLLLHGYEGRSSNFARLVPALLAQGYSPVAYDTFGHGESEGESASIVDNARINRAMAARHGTFAAVVGHSIGATSAFFSLRDGMSTDRLVSISAWCDFTTLFQGFCAYYQLTPDVVTSLRGHVERSMLPVTDIWERLSASYRPEEVAARVLLVHDEEDREVPVGQARRIAESYGDRARLHLTKGLGHRRILQDPGTVEVVMRFLADA